MRRNRWLLGASLTLILTACATDEGDNGDVVNGDNGVDETPVMSEAADESLGTAEGAQLDQLMDEPDLYLEDEVEVTAEVATAIESANAWILVAGDQDVLLVGDPGDMEIAEGDTIRVRGSFHEYNPANIGEYEGVVDEAAIEQAFMGEYVIEAEEILPEEPA